MKTDDITKLEPFDVLLNKYAKVPNIKRFEAVNGECVYKGDTITLHWEIENYTAAYVNGKLIRTENQDSCKETIKSDKNFCLKVINGLHVVSSDISVRVVEKPNIQFSSTTKKLKQGKHEHATLQWNIDNAISALLITNGKEKSIDLNGREDVSPLETSTYALKVKGLDGKKYFNRRLTLSVLPESEIEFKADKLYSLPRIPVSVSWNVRHANSVELIGYGMVPNKGEKIIEIGKDTSLVLKVTDEFGVQSKKLNIKILPLPVIKSIMVPTPQITKNIVVQNQLTHIQAAVSIHPDFMVLADNFQGMKLPAFEDLHIKLHGQPQFSEIPIFHQPQIDIVKKTWWRKIADRFIDLNNRYKNHIYGTLWKTKRTKN